MQRKQTGRNQLMYQKEKIANESAECRQKRLLTQQQYRKKIATNSTITDEINTIQYNTIQ